MHDFSHLSENWIELLQLSIDGKPIEHVQYVKLLGILFDENMEMSYKYGNQCIVESNWNTLNRLKPVYPQNALLSMYHSLLHPN